MVRELTNDCAALFDRTVFVSMRNTVCVSVCKLLIGWCERLFVQGERQEEGAARAVLIDCVCCGMVVDDARWRARV